VDRMERTPMRDADARDAYLRRLDRCANDHLRRKHEEATMPDPAIPAELPTPVRAAMARLDLATRALPRDMQQNVFELAEEIYWHGRRHPVVDLGNPLGWTPEQIRQHEEFNASLPAPEGDDA
jgi:hypothetical protein